MNTLSPNTYNDNPKKYTVYALVEQGEQITWADVRYIGLSNNVLYRFQQHLACRVDDANEDKNDWIRGQRLQGKTPRLCPLEVVSTLKQGREREQYWIRYAIAQGANLFNVAIKHTSEELAERHQGQAERNIQVSELLAQGTYVKRYGHGYPGRLLAPYQGKRKLTILNARYKFIETVEGKSVSVEFATDEEFDAFIRQYVPVEEFGTDVWHVAERCQVINFACYLGIIDFE